MFLFLQSPYKLKYLSGKNHWPLTLITFAVSRPEVLFSISNTISYFKFEINTSVLLIIYYKSMS